MKVVAVIDDEDTVYKILRHLGLLAAPEESRAPPAAAPVASPASPPAQVPLPLTDSPASPPTALLDSIPRDLFSDAPAWDAPEPPAPDHATPDLPGADADPGPDPANIGDGDPPDDEDIA
ncbi:MAG: hypothetical protein IT202_03230 [Fimbriimonadaceae bacterium]|nr:hypothetical protein [Fimbriimonadaceae bacterium]